MIVIIRVIIISFFYLSSILALGTLALVMQRMLR